jgi:predicted transcriptional regulator
MKRTLCIGISSYEEMKARTLAIAKGTLKVSKHDPKVWFVSMDSLAKVLSEKNRILLEVIATTNDLSLTELAEKTGRKKSNLSRTLKTMQHYGIVQLTKKGGKLIPNVPYAHISLTVPIHHQGAHV